MTKAEQVIKAMAQRDIGYCYLCVKMWWFWLDESVWRCAECDHTLPEAFEATYHVKWHETSPYPST